MTDQENDIQKRPLSDMANALRELGARLDSSEDVELILAAAQRIEETVPAAELPVPDYELKYLGGNCPVQAEGTIDGKPFYFRARGERWSVGIGGNPLMKPEWVHREAYGSSFEAGWMEEDEAKALLEQTLALYAAGRPGAEIPSGS